MLNFLTSKPLILALFVSISLCVMFGYLSYTFYGQKEKAEESLRQALAANSMLEQSLTNQTTVCKVGDSTTAEFKKEEQEVEKDTNNTVSEIDKMVVVKKETVVAKEATKNEESNYVALDGRLPDSLVRLLSEHCLRTKGSACSHP